MLPNLTSKMSKKYLWFNGKCSKLLSFMFKFNFWCKISLAKKCKLLVNLNHCFLCNENKADQFFTWHQLSEQINLLQLHPKWWQANKKCSFPNTNIFAFLIINESKRKSQWSNRKLMCWCENHEKQANARILDFMLGCMLKEEKGMCEHSVASLAIYAFGKLTIHCTVQFQKFFLFSDTLTKCFLQSCKFCNMR